MILKAGMPMISSQDLYPKYPSVFNDYKNIGFSDRYKSAFLDKSFVLLPKARRAESSVRPWFLKQGIRMMCKAFCSIWDLLVDDTVHSLNLKSINNWIKLNCEIDDLSTMTSFNQKKRKSWWRKFYLNLKKNAFNH